jgi:FlaG/FlaF family flagellin (archaellin)
MIPRFFLDPAAVPVENGLVTAMVLAVPQVRQVVTRAVLLGGAVFSVSCGPTQNPYEPTPAAAITSVRYEHVSSMAIPPDARVEFEFWDCRRLGARQGGAGPDVCLLTRASGSVYTCPVASFMADAPTTCDSSVVVRLRTPSGDPFFATGHDIFLNGMKVSRLRTVTGLDYPQEIGDFSIGSDGRIR